MNKRHFKKSIIPLLGLCATLSFSACTEWTDVDNKVVEYPAITEQNPELYAQYLTKLKEYKESEHKAMYVWFDNSIKDATHRSHHINNVPDSVDVVVLNSPDSLISRELEEMQELRDDKGTKIVYSISLESIKADHNALIEETEEAKDLAIEEATKKAEADLNAAKEAGNENAKLEDFLNLEEIEKDFIIPEFEDFLTEALQDQIKIANKYNYDGIIVGYVGKGTLHMFPDEKKKYTETENLFLGLINSWIERNPEKMVIFEGKPQNLINKDILQISKHIIISTHTASNSANITFEVGTAIAEGIPVDRFIVTAQVPSLDPNKEEAGKWANGTLAIPSTATWATGKFTYTIAGMGILDVNTDYFTQPSIYTLTREAINTLNPSLK
ncbi:putative lipoprotein [Bacteroides coprosuis DSM 18011]|uniref:Putative lipoprotein n=1 Tax=Bacteroides coprosuis DSM 18011 TaxID=679937 RepID=F3ZTN8_9BACE|nr:glycoside hydrolase family 18 [Bacteroides coprosuis]EGJ71269.1 putative lipoprotein [Bacteroides coprosuis DSM 18011]